jgi:hypothetical protein
MKGQIGVEIEARYISLAAEYGTCPAFGERQFLWAPQQIIVVEQLLRGVTIHMQNK